MALNRLSPQKSKAALARELGVSRQSLYYKPKLPEKDMRLKAEIETVMLENRAYGHRRIALALIINKKRARRVMKLFRLHQQRRRRAPPYKPKDRGLAPMPIPNRIQGIRIEAPHQVWVTDFTYLPHYERFVYLATWEDVFTREVVGWEMSVRHTDELISAALLNALRAFPAPTLAHSDQGSEYRSKRYLHLLKRFAIQPSMSDKASPWQNGYKEAFYSGFKLEFGHPECYSTIGELIEAVAHHIYYYNNRRIHTALKCPPTVFAKRCSLQKSTMLQLPNNHLTHQQITEGLSV